MEKRFIDNYQDHFRVRHSRDLGRVYLDIEESSRGDFRDLEMEPNQARRVARALLKAADKAEACND